MDTALAPRRFIRAGIALTAIVSFAAFAVRLHAQQPSAPAMTVIPVVGALVTLGSQRDAMESAAIVGAQAAWRADPNIAVIGAFLWARSRELQAARQPSIDLYQYDLGVEARLDDLTARSSIATRPHVVVGAGVRTYTAMRTDPLLYSAIGVELGQRSGAYGLRLQARDNITAFKGFHGELGERTARHDLQLSAGLTFGL